MHQEGGPYYESLGADIAKKIRSSPDSDVLYFLFAEGQEDYFDEPIPGVHVEYDETGNVIGVEVLNVSKSLKGFVDSLPPTNN